MPVTELATSVQSTEEILAVAARRGITRLAHFTPLQNLLGIVEMNALVARERLLDLVRERSDRYLLDYIAFNDRLRLDRLTGHINLSVTHPNAALFRRFREACRWCDVWCVLLVSADCLAWPGVIFSVGNAASSQVRLRGTGSSAARFEALFAERLVSSNRFGMRVLTRERLAPDQPTDPQAEVMVPGEIPLDRVVGIAFENSNARARAMAALRVLCPDADLPHLVVMPELFSERKMLHG